MKTRNQTLLVAVALITAMFMVAPVSEAAGLGGLLKRKKKDAAPAAPVTFATPGDATVPEINATEAFKSRHNNNARKAISGAGKVAVAGFRVAFNTRGQAHASTDSRFLNLGNRDSYTTDSRATLIVDLAGVSPETFHAVAKTAYDELIAKLKSSGVEVVPFETLKANANYQAIEKETSPYHRKKKMGGSQEFQIASSPDLPLFFMQGDILLQSAGSAFKISTSRSLNSLSADLDAAIVIPTITLDFAKMSSSGTRKMFKKSSEVGAEAEVAVLPGLSTMMILTSKNKYGGDAGAVSLRQGVTVPGAFGEMELTKSRSNAGLVTAFNLLGAKGGTVSKRTEYTINANEPAFQELTSAGSKAAARAFADFIAQNIK